MSRAIKGILKVVLILVLIVVLVVGGYVAYLLIQYHRIEDGTPLEVENPQAAAVQPGTPYTALTYNIGFGAYDHAFSFFMDSGTMLDGTPVVGRYAKAREKDTVRRNTAGAIGIASGEAADFLLFQEADVDSDRSFHINQVADIRSAFPSHASVYASNFHSAFLAYPFADPHGAVESGLVTLSRESIGEAVRRSYPVDESFPTKFFDLDRCFSLLRLPVEGGGELVLINTHMSAFDEGGTIRAAQLAMLGEVLAAERAAGNWVVVGGDFNHALGGTVEAFPSQQEVPEWVYPFDDSLLPEGFSVVLADNLFEVATCRSTDLSYNEGVNYSAVLDGFIVSDNVAAAAHNIDAGFEYSDHNPVRLTFTLEQV